MQVPRKQPVQRCLPVRLSLLGAGSFGRVNAQQVVEAVLIRRRRLKQVGVDKNLKRIGGLVLIPAQERG
jgi:hypothetical protein